MMPPRSASGIVECLDATAFLLHVGSTPRLGALFDCQCNSIYWATSSLCQHVCLLACLCGLVDTSRGQKIISQTFEMDLWICGEIPCQHLPTTIPTMGRTCESVVCTLRLAPLAHTASKTSRRRILFTVYLTTGHAGIHAKPCVCWSHMATPPCRTPCRHCSYTWRTSQCTNRCRCRQTGQICTLVLISSLAKYARRVVDRFTAADGVPLLLVVAGPYENIAMAACRE